MVASTIAENTPIDTIGSNVASGASTKEVITVNGLASAKTVKSAATPPFHIPHRMI
ncbi:hypothetical protein [Enterococcus faecalis]